MASLSCSRTRLLGAATGVLALLATLLAAPAGAQLQEGTCPSSVDTTDEGWICSLLISETPTESPSNEQIDLWMDALGADGRLAVTDGIIFSDASVEAKVRTLYQTQLNREPDPSGLTHWRERIQDARTEFAAEFGVFGSGEYLSQLESPEAFVNDQYQYYLGREASRDEQAYWAGRFNRGELSNEGITRAIAQSPEAGNVRARLLYEDYLRRSPEPGGLAYWSPRAADQGLFTTSTQFATSVEAVNTLGRIGVELAGNEPSRGEDAAQDIVVAPQEVLTPAAGEPVEISVLQRRDGGPVGTVDLTLFPCDNVGATDSPVPFADTDDNDLADGIASTAADQAYISQVNGQPTGGRELYVDDAQAGSDGILRFTVVAGPNPDCAVVAVIDDVTTPRQLSLDAQDHAEEPFGVTKVDWQ